MIKINDNLFIDVDDNCYTVKVDKHKVDKDGKDIHSAVGYYGTLESALIGAKEFMIREELSNGEYSIAEAIEEIKSVNGYFTSKFKESLK